MLTNYTEANVQNFPEVSLIIISEKDSEKIFETLQKVQKYFHEQKMEAEIILADREKSFGTIHKSFLPIIISFNFGVSCQKSLKSAIESAQGKYIFITDLDLSTPISEMERFLRYLQSGEEVVVGSRRMGFSKTSRFFLFSLMDELNHLWARALRLTDLTDTQGTFLAYEAGVAKALYSKAVTSDRLLAFETLFLARKLQFRMVEIPVSWEGEKNLSRETFSKYLFFPFQLLALKLKFSFDTFLVRKDRARLVKKRSISS
ncbi:MAG: glycosyltransferase [Patescibacteria group bacterium]|nr:glycosyltransferase [Patescibacteria group bacterium]